MKFEVMAVTLIGLVEKYEYVPGLMTTLTIAWIKFRSRLLLDQEGSRSSLPGSTPAHVDKSQGKADKIACQKI